MAIAYDTFSSGGTPSTSPLSWTHTPIGTPRGVVVLVIQDAGSNESVAATYGGNAMTALTVADGSALGEPGWIYPFWLGSSILTGARTVTWTDTGAATKGAIAYTVTAAADVEIEDETTSTGTTSNPSHTLTTGASVETMCFSAIFSGAGTHTNVTAGAGWTKDLGSNAYTGQSGCFEHLTATDAGSNVTTAWAVTASDWLLYSIALKESAGGTAHTAEPADTLSLADATAKAQDLGRTDTLTLADLFARTTVTARSVIDTLSLADLADPQLLAPSAVTREIRLRL